MCFYNSFTTTAKSVANRYKRKEGKQLSLFEDELYVMPAYAHPNTIIINLKEEPQIMEWGLIPATSKVDDKERYRKQNWFINARAEEIFNTWPYKHLIRQKRCIIPSTGFYEYHYETVKGKSVTSLYFVAVKDEEIFSIGGLYDSWINQETGEIHNTYTMITTHANELMRFVHNGGSNPFRMPLILPCEMEERFLDLSLSDAEISSMLVSFPTERMEAYEIDKAAFTKGGRDPHNRDLRKRKE